MKILIASTYYKPHISGVTVYAQELAEALAQGGHDVNILTSRYKKELEKTDILNDVHIHRIPMQFWISKGAIMLGYMMHIIPAMRKNDIVVMNLPNTFIETFAIGFLAKIMRKPLAVIYHCDIELPRSVFNKIVNFVVYCVNSIGCGFADQIVTNTEDYSERSKVLRRFKRKAKVIPPPVSIARPDPVEVEKWRKKYAPDGEAIIGFLGRFAAEKGIHHLIQSLPYVHQELPGAKLLLAGDYQHVIGEQDYYESLKPLIDQNEKYVTLLGALPDEQKASFLGWCDVIVLPSTNNTETFGIVQVESMLCGTPVVSSNLPGVRAPIQTSGMGLLTEPGNPQQLGEAILTILKEKSRFIKAREEIEAIYSSKVTADGYTYLLRGMLDNVHSEQEQGRG